MSSGSALYILAAALLLISFIKSRDKTKKALKKGWKAFTGILPQMLLVLLLIGLVLTFLSPQAISKLLGKDSGFKGTLFSTAVGSVTLIPGFVAFPLAEALLKSGAGITQIAAFVDSLMMVGIVTFPMETAAIGKKSALWRNLFSLIWALITAYIMGALL